MSSNPSSTVYIGNLDERVSDRVLYDILIQAGRVVDLYFPRDRETDKPKGYAFAEYETEEIAEYAVRLFSGLVTLYNRTLKFGISGQDRPSSNVPPSVLSIPNASHDLRSHPPGSNNEKEIKSPMPCRSSANPANYSQVPVTSGVNYQSNRYGSHYDGNHFEYSRRDYGASLGTINRTRSRRFDTSNSISYNSY